LRVTVANIDVSLFIEKRHAGEEAVPVTGNGPGLQKVPVRAEALDSVTAPRMVRDIHPPVFIKSQTGRTRLKIGQLPHSEGLAVWREPLNSVVARVEHEQSAGSFDHYISWVIELTHGTEAIGFCAG
jgi:hypothetical protein